MTLIVIRTTIIFITLMIVMRLMGKRQIGEMQPFELVITLIIADFASIPMADTTIPLLYGLVAILSIFILHQVLCLIDLKCKSFRTILSGSPSLVIDRNGINSTVLKQNNMDVSDLIESVRSAGYPSLAAVRYGIYESSGQFSALPNRDFTGDSLAILLVNHGEYEMKNLSKINMSRQYLDDVLSDHQTNVEQIVAFTVDGDGNCYLQVEGKPYETFTIALPKGCAW
ncbi:MAG: DUF421 domain-containing protein [Christensenellaceae bacterium]